MTAVPTTLTAVAGAVLTASEWNLNNRGPVDWSLAPAILEIRQTVAQAVGSSSAATTPMTCTTEDVDSTGMHSTSSNTSRCTAVYPGWYRVSGGCAFAANSTGSRGCAWAVNGTALNGSFAWLPANGSGFTSTPARSKQLFLNVGDYAELFLAQTSGGSLNTSVASVEQGNISMTWVSN